jgi:NTE family protein
MKCPEVASLDDASVFGSLEAPKEERLAFVLSGGGSLGSLQVGCLEALMEQGLVPDMIVGTSVGAINGAWLAKHPTLEGMAQLKDMWLSPRRKGVFLEGRLRMLMRLLLGRDFIYANKALRELLCHNLYCSTFEELAVDLFVTATDIESGELAVFQSGPLMPAILASSAIPGVFKAVEVAGRTYIDGAMISNCSIETAWRHGATTIVAIECPHTLPERRYGVVGVLARAFSVSLARLCRLERERFRRLCNLVVLEPNVDSLEGQSQLDFSHAAELMAEAKQWTAEFLSSPSAAALGPWIGRRRSGPARTHSAEVTTAPSAAACDCSNCTWSECCMSVTRSIAVPGRRADTE